MNPLQRYQQDLDMNLVSPDEGQRKVVMHFQRLFDAILADKPKADSWRSIFRRSTPSRGIKGIYLWGGVGRGKTYLMDLFYECLPLERKHRTHFHRFMQRIHSDLIRFQGIKNPLEKVADGIAKESSVLCFDEFFVQDIGDAMILAGLLDALFRRDVVLVMTSNITPQRLYENGLQRDRFLPAIELIKRNTRIVEIQKGIDFRLRSLSQATLYHCPIDELTEGLLLNSFSELAPEKSEITVDGVIEILGRNLQFRYCADDVVWFEFEQLCGGPRSAFDYIEIAKLFHAVLLSALPQLNDTLNDQARRFVSLVDELYDRRVKLILAAAVPISDLYQGESLVFEFERTRSRLLEMQSHEYLAYEHRG